VLVQPLSRTFQLLQSDFDFYDGFVIFGLKNELIVNFAHIAVFVSRQKWIRVAFKSASSSSDSYLSQAQ
jgi:hypothetical protein